MDDESRGVWRLPPAETSRGGGGQASGGGMKRGRPSEEAGGGASRSGLAGKGVVVPARGTTGHGQAVPWHDARALVGSLLRLHSHGSDSGASASGGGGGGGAAARSAAPAFFSPPSASPLLRLHEEVLDFCAFMSPTPSEVAIAGRALAGVHGVIASLFPEATIEVFGSRALGLVLPTSDWDIVCCGVVGTRANMARIAGEMSTRGVARRTEVIDSARVPIVKVWEAASGICVDISFESAAASARSSRGVMLDLMARFPPARPLALVLKYFLLQRGLNDTFTGGIGSYLLVLLSVAVVQAALRNARAAGARAPEGASASTSASASASSASAASSARAAAAPPAPPATAASVSAALSARHGGAELNLGALLLSALELYGRTLNLWDVGISVRGELGGFYTKASRRWADGKSPSALSVESPVDPTQDVGRGAWGIQKCRRALAAAHCSLSRAVRAWGSHSACKAGGAYGPVVAAQAPVSLLGAVIRVDDLLRVRAAELAGQKEEAEGEVGGGGGGGVGAGAGAAGGKRQKREGEGEGEDEGEGEGGSSAGSGEGAEASGLGEGAGGDVEASTLPSPVEAPEALSAEGIRAAAFQRLELLAGGGTGAEVQLRHKRLLSDILTRKQRGVPVVQAAPEGWY